MRELLAALMLCMRRCPSVLGAPICAVLMAGLVPAIVANSAPWKMSAKSARLIVKNPDRVINAVYPPPNVFSDAKAVKTESFKPNPSVVKVSKARQHLKRQRHQRHHGRRSTRYAATE